MEEFCAQLHGPWRGARTPSSPPNIGDFATPSDGRTDGRTSEERDTLKSTYVKQLPLFGKATEVAKIADAARKTFLKKFSKLLIF